MKEQIGFNQFCDRFREANRDNQFTYEGKRALFDYLKGYEEDTGQEMELDIIALCCEFCEYSDLEEFLKEYNESEFEKEEDEEDEDFKARIEEEIQQQTTLIKLGDDLDEGFIIQSY